MRRLRLRAAAAIMALSVCAGTNANAEALLTRGSIADEGYTVLAESIKSAYADDAIPAESVKVTSSGDLTDKYGTYRSINAYDSDLTTTWAEDAPGDGKGEWIKFTFPTMYLRGFVIWSGYQKSDETFRKNNRPKEIMVQTDKNFFVVELDDLKKAQLCEFDDFEYTGTLKLEIRSVYEGSKYDDTCISDVKILNAW